MPNDEKKKMIDRRVSKWDRFVFSVKVFMSLARPSEFDDMIVQLRKERQRAEDITRMTKATLNGEEDWFKPNLNGGSEKDDR